VFEFVYFNLYFNFYGMGFQFLEMHKTYIVLIKDKYVVNGLFVASYFGFQYLSIFLQSQNKKKRREKLKASE